MKNTMIWGTLIVGITMVIAIAMALRTGERSPIYVSGSLVLDESLAEQAAGIQTLFLILYDADSSMPMPYGAVKESLRTHAQAGEFYDFYITKEKLQLMNENQPPPANLRVKARLDLDGVAGMDQPGDLTGEVSRVALGARDLKIAIDRYVE